MLISKKRAVGKVLGRGGISQRIITLAEDITIGSYKNAIEKGAQIAQLVDAASFDEHWSEKSGIGRNREIGIFETVLKISDQDGFRGRMVSKVSPYDAI